MMKALMHFDSCAGARLVPRGRRRLIAAVAASDLKAHRGLKHRQKVAHHGVAAEARLRSERPCAGLRDVLRVRGGGQAPDEGQPQELCKRVLCCVSCSAAPAGSAHECNGENDDGKGRERHRLAPFALPSLSFGLLRRQEDHEEARAEGEHVRHAEAAIG